MLSCSVLLKTQETALAKESLAHTKERGHAK